MQQNLTMPEILRAQAELNRMYLADRAVVVPPAPIPLNKPKRIRGRRFVKRKPQ